MKIRIVNKNLLILYMVITERIKEKGLKKNWLAKKLNISKTALSFFLNGQRQMPENIENKLKELLK